MEATYIGFAFILGLAIFVNSNWLIFKGCGVIVMIGLLLMIPGCLYLIFYFFKKRRKKRNKPNIVLEIIEVFNRNKNVKRIHSIVEIDGEWKSKCVAIEFESSFGIEEIYELKNLPDSNIDTNKMGRIFCILKKILGGHLIKKGDEYYLYLNRNNDNNVQLESLY